MGWLKYKEWLDELLEYTKGKGITVKFVNDYVTRDYVGMNPEIADAMGFAMPDDTIYIDKNLSYKAKYHTLRHELEEMDLMSKGTKYWKAHCKSLRNEKKSPEGIVNE
jgi:hypothetical protein